MSTNNQPLWQPSKDRVAKARLSAFVKTCDRPRDYDYHALWRWSCENPEIFWDKLWDFAGVMGEKGDTVLENAPHMMDAQFFPKGKLNYAENLLRKTGQETAIIFRNEMGEEKMLSWDDLRAQVACAQGYLLEKGVEKGDRVAAFMPNCPETLIMALAASSIGAVFSSASPDFGVQGVLDRFGQIEPKILLGTNGYYYGGKSFSCIEKMNEIVANLPSLEGVILYDFIPAPEDKITFEHETWNGVLKAYEGHTLSFISLPFNHPLFIMFSSGTTGVPKCIVHGAGGTLLQHLKEWILQCDINEGDPVFYFTTCGWMMWNWLISALAVGAPLLLYDGSPAYPDMNVLWDYTSRHNCVLFGTSAKYIDAIKGRNIHPARDFDLSALKILTSTGSPLMHESFDYIYSDIKSDLHVASIYGGTDIISASFGIGNPWSPVWRGELQGPALATPVNVFDDDGKSVEEGAGAGELVCTDAIPSMPIGFWNDKDNAKYKRAYFERYENIWHHGDWVEKTKNHGLIVHGRSDATLNPGGVRIGTAEIYRQVEQVESVEESIAVGQNWQGDVRVILFVKMKEGVVLDNAIRKDIRDKVKKGASPRHVPAKIIQVQDIPRTKSGKIVEIAVRHTIHGRAVQNTEALANPEALDHYKDLAELSA